MNNAPIKNAKNTSLSANPGTLPNMQSTLANWFQKLVFTRVIKETINFKVQETRIDYHFMGVRQPFGPQKLDMKPEGQRKWKWETVHAYPDLVLEPDEIIYFRDVPYRVMEKYDWTEYGYVEYHLVQDYEET